MHAYDALSTSELGNNACRCVEGTFPRQGKDSLHMWHVYVQGYVCSSNCMCCTAPQTQQEPEPISSILLPTTGQSDVI